jgi:hypothetical protein
MGCEIFMVFKEMTLGVRIVFIPKFCLDIKITRLVYDSYVLSDEANPCLLEDVHEVLILCYCHPLSVKHHNLGSINLDIEQDLVKAVDTHIQIKYWLYLLSN